MKARSCPKLPKGPTVQHAPLALANRFPRAFADALKIFQGNAARGACRRLHHGLRPTLIHVRGTPPLPAAALREQALARLRALLLELRAEAAEPCPRLVHVGVPRTGGLVQGLPVRRGGQRDDAQVYPDVVARVLRRWLWSIYRHRQKEGGT